MKKFFIVFVCLFAVYSCRSQELYIVIDTRDTVNMWSKINLKKDKDYIKGEYEVEYFIKKSDPTDDYGGGVLFQYRPYTDSVLNKWKRIKKLRTQNISKKKWTQIKQNPNIKIVDGVKWVQNSNWDTIYKYRIKYFFEGNMYIVDKKNTTKDSLEIRGIKLIDTRAQE